MRSSIRSRLAQRISDPRRAEGKLYKLQHVLLFSILAVVTGGNSYRSIVTFIKVHRRRLNAAFGLHWRRAPAHTSIRYILQGLEPQAVEQIFRQHAAGLCAAPLPIRHDVSSRSMARRSDEASTISPTARRPRSCTPSTSKPVSSWRTSISRKSPTKSPPRSSCSANSMSHTASSRSMPCIAKKTFEAAAQVQARLIVQLKDNQPSLLQKVETACASQRPVSSDTSVATGRNRYETRSADVFSATRSVARN